MAGRAKERWDKIVMLEHLGCNRIDIPGGGLSVFDDLFKQRVVEIGTAIVPTLIEAVEEKLPPDEWYNYNYKASEALGLIGRDASSAVPALSKVLKESKNPRIRRDAAAALGRIGGNAEVAVPALTSALDDPWATVRAAAAKALPSFAQDAQVALPKLRQLERSEFASIRKPAKAAIAALEDR